MGKLLSKFRKSKPSLEEQLESIDKELKDLRVFQVETEVEQKRILGQCTLFGILLYLVGILAFYVLVDREGFTWVQHLICVLPFLVFPFMILCLRRLLSWWYQRKLVKSKPKIEDLRKERERLLDEVMDKETFNVAKKILEKYAPSHLIPKYIADQQMRAALTPPHMRPQRQDALRRRTFGGATATQPMGMRPFPGPGPMRGQLPPTRAPVPAIMGAPGTPQRPNAPGPSITSTPTGMTPMRFMMPRPPLNPVYQQRKVGWFDKLVDYMVQDGPNYRYALICRYCATNNGLAPKEEFPYIGYRCIYCRQWNPPRERRPDAPTLPRNTVLIEEVESRETSRIESEEPEVSDREQVHDGEEPEISDREQIHDGEEESETEREEREETRARPQPEGLDSSGGDEGKDISLGHEEISSSIGDGSKSIGEKSGEEEEESFHSTEKEEKSPKSTEDNVVNQ